MIPRTYDSKDAGQVGTGNYHIEQTLENAPDLVASALQKWRMATLQRERIEALLYLEFKTSSLKGTAEEIKAMVRSSDSRYNAVIEEVKAESNYVRLYERLLAAKKSASLRTAF